MVRPNKSVWSRERLTTDCQTRRMGSSCSKPPNFSITWGEVFKGKIWGEGCKVCDFLLLGWWWGNRLSFQECQSSGSNQSGVYVLVVSMQSPSSTWGALSFIRTTQRYVWDCYLFPIREIGSCDSVVLWTAWACSLKLGKGLGEWSLLFLVKIRNRGHRRTFVNCEGLAGSCSVSKVDFIQELLGERRPQDRTGLHLEYEGKWGFTAKEGGEGTRRRVSVCG